MATGVQRSFSLAITEINCYSTVNYTLQSGVVAALQFVHWVRLSPPSGRYPTNGTLSDPPEAAAMTVASPETDSLRSTVTPPDVPVLVLPLL